MVRAPARRAFAAGPGQLDDASPGGCPLWTLRKEVSSEGISAARMAQACRRAGTAGREGERCAGGQGAHRTAPSWPPRLPSTCNGTLPVKTTRTPILSKRPSREARLRPHPQHRQSLLGRPRQLRAQQQLGALAVARSHGQVQRRLRGPAAQRAPRIRNVGGQDDRRHSSCMLANRGEIFCSAGKQPSHLLRKVERQWRRRALGGCRALHRPPPRAHQGGTRRRRGRRTAALARGGVRGRCGADARQECAEQHGIARQRGPGGDHEEGARHTCELMFRRVRLEACDSCEAAESEGLAGR
jgi:hypothetical protein